MHQKLTRQRNNLTLKIAQLDSRLVQYTLKKNQQQTEHIKHSEKVTNLEKQLQRARDILSKSEEILRAIELRRSSCLVELKGKRAELQDLVVRITDPMKWTETIRSVRLELR